MNKVELIAQFRGVLEARAVALRKGVGSARNGTRVDGDHRPANRGERGAVTSQGYLAKGMSERLTALESDLRILSELDPGPRDRVVPGALVTMVDDDDVVSRYLILPGGQGDALDDVIVVSANAPVIRGVFGGVEGDEAKVRRGDRTRTVFVETIA